MLSRRQFWLLAAGAGLSAGAGLLAWRVVAPGRNLIKWFTQSDGRADLVTHAGLVPCPGAPFILPSSGFIGLLWNDTRLPYSPLQRHSGIDIFGEGEPGQVAVYAAYDGLLTRLPGWKSAVIIRHPNDPLDPSRQIWTYYAHMASETGQSYIVAAFPPGSSEIPVVQGTLLGFQGVYNGGKSRVGLHLHFSIVRDDGSGRFLNETDIRHTLDPSPYLGMRLNHACAEGVASCATDLACP